MGEAIRVLHVDDEPDFAGMVAHFLEAEGNGIAVETARSTGSGMSMLESEVYDCVVSDYDMPEQNGIEFLRTVREEHSDLPFILFTGKGSEDVASEAISAGVTDYLQKGSSTSQYAVLANRIENAVSARRSALSARRRQHRIEQILKTVPACVVQINYEGQFVFANDRAEEVLGLVQEEVSDRAYNDPEWEITDLDGDQIPDGKLPFRRVRDSGEPVYDFRHTITWPDGTRRILRVNGAPIFDSDGDVESTVFALSDITDRKQREREMERLLDQMKLALQGANSWIWDWEVQSDEVTQTAVTGILGIEEETITRPIGDFLDQIHPEDREVFFAAKEEAVRTDNDYHVEYRLIVDDEVRWINSRGQMYQDTSGDSARLIGIATDVTRVKERSLERQWMQTALDQSSEAVFISDPDTANIEYVNDTACERLGYEREDLLELTILDIQPELSTEEKWQAHIERLRSEGHDLFEGIHVRNDGTRFPVEVNTGIVEIERREYLLGIARDITHRREREEELQRQIDQLDEFTSIVSHDLRNPLNVAQGKLELAREETDSDHFDDIGRAHERMDALVNDLLTLAHEGGSEADPVDLADVVRNCWRNVETHDATLQVDFGETIYANQGRLAQLVENLIRNAVEHGGGDVTVTVGELEGGFYVEDDGPGIPEDERADLFEAGYSTSEDGTGFGLSIVKQVAESHGWDVLIDSDSEGGARFDVTGVTFVDE